MRISPSRFSHFLPSPSCLEQDGLSSHKGLWLLAGANPPHMFWLLCIKYQKGKPGKPLLHFASLHVTGPCGREEGRHPSQIFGWHQKSDKLSRTSGKNSWVWALGETGHPSSVSCSKTPGSPLGPAEPLCMFGGKQDKVQLPLFLLALSWEAQHNVQYILLRERGLSLYSLTKF